MNKLKIKGKSHLKEKTFNKRWYTDKSDVGIKEQGVKGHHKLVH